MVHRPSELNKRIPEEYDPLQIMLETRAQFAPYAHHMRKSRLFAARRVNARTFRYARLYVPSWVVAHGVVRGF